MGFKNLFDLHHNNWSSTLCTQGHRLKEEFQAEYKELFFHHDSWNKLPQRGCAVSILECLEDHIKP